MNCLMCAQKFDALQLLVQGTNMTAEAMTGTRGIGRPITFNETQGRGVEGATLGPRARCCKRTCSTSARTWEEVVPEKAVAELEMFNNVGVCADEQGHQCIMTCGVVWLHCSWVCGQRIDDLLPGTLTFMAVKLILTPSSVSSLQNRDRLPPAFDVRSLSDWAGGTESRRSCSGGS